MIAINTKRLTIIPLNVEYLKLLINNPRELELKLSLSQPFSDLGSELKKAMEVRHSKALVDELNYIWYTNWIIVSNDKSKNIGGIMLKGLPNKDGEVVIGYYTITEYQGNGYMTEAVSNLKNWLLSQPDVRFVIADTEKDNIASHRVLEKAGAIMYQETDELYYWRFS